MRIWRNGALVLYPPGHDDEGDVVEIPSPYAWEELWNADGTALVKWEQSNDVMTLYHPQRFVRELKRFDHHDWTLEIRSFEPTIQPPASMTLVATYVYTSQPGETGEQPKEHRLRRDDDCGGGRRGEPAVAMTDTATNLLGYDQNCNTSAGPRWRGRRSMPSTRRRTGFSG